MSFSIPSLFLAGLLTFLSPCVLPLVPIYLAMLAGTSAAAVREGEGRGRLVAGTIAFALGLALVFVTLGLAASAVGRALSGHRVLLLQLAGVAVFLAGLKLTGLVQVPWLDREARPYLASVRKGGGLLWPFLLGAAFALGWSPCIGPVLGSVLVFAGSTGSAPMAAFYLGIYALGLTLPLVAVSLASPIALRLLDRAKRHLRRFEIASGALLAALGLLFVTGHVSVLMTPLATAPSASVPAVVPAAAAPATCSANASPADDAPAPLSSIGSENERSPALLKFVAADCSICQRMAPVVAAAERACSRHGVRVEEIDVATAAGRARAAKHGVLGVPTFLFVERDGAEVARLVGEQPREVLVQSLEVLAGHECDGFRAFEQTPAAGT
ncbi:MAG: sulfite exporter TauE/SafE family protein [Deltaproteobacteria bacterium]|nr:sulfite exporter TauE/SafE family protein [Deltaproteobacteria bacterium]